MWFIFQRLSVGFSRHAFKSFKNKKIGYALLIFVFSFALWLVSLALR